MLIESVLCKVCKRIIPYRTLYDLSRRPGRTRMPSHNGVHWTVFNNVIAYIPGECSCSCGGVKPAEAESSLSIHLREWFYKNERKETS